MSIESIKIMGSPVVVEPPEFFSTSPTLDSYPRRITFGDVILDVNKKNILPLFEARAIVCGAVGYSVRETAETFGVATGYITQLRSDAYKSLGATSIEHAVDRCFDEEIFDVSSHLIIPGLSKLHQDVIRVAGSGLNVENQANEFGFSKRTLDRRRNEVTKLMGVGNMAAAVLLTNIQKAPHSSNELVIHPGKYYLEGFPTAKDDTIEWHHGALRLPHDGFFSDTERFYLGLAAIGQTNEEIANHVNSRASTVQHHFSSMYRKLDLDNLPKDVKRMLAITRSFEDEHIVIDRYNDLLQLKPLERIILQGYADGKLSAQIALDIPPRYGKFTSGAVRNITSELNERLQVPNTIAAVALAYLSGNIKGR